ncbi:MAG: hypA [Myxococcales bacterium]|nr:hypA [Myxococcales bacterium]
MHELALTENILATITERLGDARVVRVRLEIGRLMAVLPDAMRFAFAVCTKDTSLDGARLEIDEVAARGRCRDCASELALDGVVALCPCGSADVELLAGQELQIKEVEVA